MVFSYASRAASRIALDLEEEEEAVGGLWDIGPAGNDHFVHFGGKMMRGVIRGRRR